MYKDIDYIKNILKNNIDTKDIILSDNENIIYNENEIFIYNNLFKIVINKQKVILYKLY